jgi:hypothetical protein
MNAAVQSSFLEDCIFDFLLSIEAEEYKSVVDAKLFIVSKLKEWGQADNDVYMDTLSNRLAVKVIMFKSSKQVPTNSKLGKLVHLVKESTIDDSLLVIYTTKENKGMLSIKTPSLDENDETSMKVLSSMLELGCLLHGVQSSNLSIFVDDKMDKTPLEITGSLDKLIEKLKASSKNPYGHWDGPDVVFGKESTFKCTPPGLLAAMRLLSTKDTLLRKIPRKSGSLQRSLTSFKLQETFNTIFGLKTDKSNAYTIKLFKAILSSAVKPHNRGFPGGFIHSNRSRNSVKSDLSVLTLLGWIPKVPIQQRLDDVLFNTVDDSYGEVNGVTKVIGRSLQNLGKKNRNMSFQEFRTAVAISVRKIDPSVGRFDEQLKKDSLSPWRPTVLNNFVENDVMTSVNIAQQSYAFKISVENPKSKTTLVHYENSRNHLLASTSQMKIKDASGKEYSTFSELPEPVQNYLRKRYRYPSKRKDNEEDDVMETDEPLNTAAANETQSDHPPQKKKRMTKHEAALARRKAVRRSSRVRTQNS